VSSSLAQRESAPKVGGSQFPKKAQMSKAFLKQEQPPQVTELPQGAGSLDARELAAVLLDQALILWGDAGQSKAVAAVLEVDESLVRKWRRTDERASPSLIQLLSLGEEFFGLLIKVECRFHRRAEQKFLELARALGDYALMREND
jgi:hypothetical protein